MEILYSYVTDIALHNKSDLRTVSLDLDLWEGLLCLTAKLMNESRRGLLEGRGFGVEAQCWLFCAVSVSGAHFFVWCMSILSIGLYTSLQLLWDLVHEHCPCVWQQISSDLLQTSQLGYY